MIIEPREDRLQWLFGSAVQSEKELTRINNQQEWFKIREGIRRNCKMNSLIDNRRDRVRTYIIDVLC